MFFAFHSLLQACWVLVFDTLVVSLSLVETRVPGRIAADAPGDHAEGARPIAPQAQSNEA